MESSRSFVGKIEIVAVGLLAKIDKLFLIGGDFAVDFQRIL